jgi:hypothetical protein
VDIPRVKLCRRPEVEVSTQADAVILVRVAEEKGVNVVSLEVVT